MPTREAVIVASQRTGLAKSFRGSFNLTRPDDMAAHCIKAVLRKVPQLDPGEIEDVVMGCGFPEGPQGFNVGRNVAVMAGLPITVPGCTVNRFCSSGLNAIAIAAHLVQDDRAECNRPATTLERLAKLPPAFREGGTVTAGNSSQFSDGASATLLMSASRAKALGIEPLGVFRGFVVAGCEPDEMGIGPVFAVPKLLKLAGLRLDDIDIRSEEHT